MYGGKKKLKQKRSVRPVASLREPIDVQTATSTRTAAASLREPNDVQTATSTRTAAQNPSLVAYTPQVQRFTSEQRTQRVSPKQPSEAATAVSTRTAMYNPSLTAYTPQVQRFGSEQKLKTISPKEPSDTRTAVSTKIVVNNPSLVAVTPQVQRHASELEVKTAPIHTYTPEVQQRSNRQMSPKTATLGAFTPPMASLKSSPTQNTTNASDLALFCDVSTGDTQFSKTSAYQLTAQTQKSYTTTTKMSKSPFQPARYVPSYYVSENTFANANTQKSSPYSVKTDRENTDIVTTSGCNTNQRNVSPKTSNIKTDENVQRSFVDRNLFALKSGAFEKMKKDLFDRQLSEGSFDIAEMEMIRKVELMHDDMSGNNLIESSQILEKLIGERTIPDDVASEALGILIDIGYISKKEMLYSEELKKYSEERNSRVSLNSLANIIYKMKSMEISDE